MHFHRDVLAICDTFPPTSFQPTAGRRLRRNAAARVHLRAWAARCCSRCAPARRRCCSRSPRPTRCSTRSRTFGATVVLHRADLVSRDDPARDRTTISFAAHVRLGRRDAACRYSYAVGERDRRPHHRRDRLDRDAAHLHRCGGRRDPSGRDRHAGAGLRRVHSRRRRRPAAARQRRAARGERPDGLPLSRRPASARVRATRLEPHRRRVSARRRRLLLVPGAHRRHDRVVRLQHRRPGSRRCAARTPAGARMRGGRRTRRSAWHDGEGVRRAARGPPATRRSPPSCKTS